MGHTNAPPEIQPIRELSLSTYTTSRMGNGMPVYSLKGGTEPVMKLELVFRAGAWYENKPGVSEFMASLLSEGTKKRTSVELAEYIESRGATLQTRGGVDTSRVRLYTLTRFLPELMEVLTEVIQQPLFDEGELKVYTNNKVERLMIDLKKNEVLAYRYLTECIFGLGHPYGKNTKPDDYLGIRPEDLHEHHSNHLIPAKGMAFVSGSFGAKELDLIHHTIGLWQPPVRNGKTTIEHPPSQSKTGVFEVDGPQTHQAAIRIGRKLFTQAHPDYPGIFMLNTILGGYFGSRLMSEIRENQGLTYGIYSSVDSFAQDGCFYISTETATANIDKMLAAIKLELEKLQADLVPDPELTMARNYIMGHLMTQLDGPFASMDYIKSMKIEHLEDQHFTQMISKILAITPEELRQLAQVYLKPEDWVTIIVR